MHDELFQRALAEMRPEHVSYILSQQPRPMSTSPVLPTFVLPASGSPDDDADGPRRRHIEREWPEVGTTLWADYYGTRYTAEIIPATKRLKSGKQIKLTSGIGNGTVCDSFSEAMLLTTEAQRVTQNLGRKGVSNGWIFWLWDGKPLHMASDGDEDDDQ